MNVSSAEFAKPGELSELARTRILSRRGEPLFIAKWQRVLMIHFEVDAELLQREVPFPLDLRAGSAFVSLVAFTMEDLHPRFGGELTRRLFQPIAMHHFLNVRTYVRVGEEVGIHFLAEWLSNRIAVALGPLSFGLPYRYGAIAYNHDWRAGCLCGEVHDGTKKFCYSADVKGCDDEFAPCAPGFVDEWLMERYTAFNSACGRKIFFRVWHSPWSQCRASVVLKDLSLLEENWSWFRHAQLVSANFSPGLNEVWMGWPHRLTSENSGR